MSSGSPGSADGFTLIELLIAMVIFAVLGAIAYPNYTAYVTQGRRADATTSLSNFAQGLERCYAQFYDYTNANCPQFPATSQQGYYNVTAAVAKSTYTLTAKPVAGGQQAGDSTCASFTISSTGSTGSSPGTTCWSGH